MSAATARDKRNTKAQEQAAPPQSSWSALISRFNNIMGQLAGLPFDTAYGIFGRVMANMAPVQNARIKALNPLPCDFTKADLNDFLTNPQN